MHGDASESGRGHALSRRTLLPLAAALALAAAPARAQVPAPAASAPLPAASAPLPAAPPIERRVFEGGEYRTRGGGTVANLRLGYQTAGALNAAGDNAVLLCHFFSGTGHAFGRLDEGGPPGWWDAIVGPGRPIDTDRYFVVAADTPVNLNIRDARVTSTGPASTDPATGRPYGMSFPVLSIRDFVETQKRLLDHLGVRRLALVAGPSMGALQAIEWAAAHPGMVARVMPVIGTGEIDAWALGALHLWESPIRLDPNWRGGDYYTQGREAPTRGLAEALKLVTLQSRDRGWARQFGRGASEGQDPARRIGDSFAVERWLDETAAARARSADANSFLYLVRANQLFLHEHASAEAALREGQASWLVVPSLGDRVFPPEYSRELAAVLERLGRPVELAELHGDLGHLEGVANVARVGDRIRAFLAR